MRRLILLLFVLLLLALGAVKWGPQQLAEPLVRILPNEVLTFIAAAPLRLPDIITPPAPADTLDGNIPLWQQDLKRARELQRKYRLSAKSIRENRLQMQEMYYLAVGDSELVSYHHASKEILILNPELTLRSKFIWRPGTEGRKPPRMRALAISSSSIATLANNGLISEWTLDGALLRSFRPPVKGFDLAYSSQGNLLVQTPGEFLIRSFRAGMPLQRMAYWPDFKMKGGAVLMQAHVVADKLGMAIAWQYPYRVQFLGINGEPEENYEIMPPFTVAAPIVESENGRLKQVVRQRIVHDAQLHEGNLWLLISPRQGSVATWLETWTRDGRFLQRFALAKGARWFGFYDDRLYVLGYYPDYPLIAYDIVPIKVRR